MFARRFYFWVEMGQAKAGQPRNLQNINFPLKLIKSYHFFESGRWDIIMRDNKVIKLPVQNYISSLQNFMDSKNNNSFNNYKIFDYRIKDQLILN